MALVAHGRADWTGEEARHLQTCPSCAAEWRVVVAAAGLGAAAAQRLDASRLGTAVLRRLRAQRRWRRTAWLGMAAAAAVGLVLWLDRPTDDRLATTTEARLEFHLPMVELESLDADQLQAVLDDLDGPLGATAAPDAPVLDDLEDQELEHVLRSLEG
jgi:hypothetical protein